MSNEYEKLVTVREAASTLAVGMTKAWGLIRDGRLEVVRLSPRCTRVKRSSLARLTGEVRP